MGPADDMFTPNWLELPPTVVGGVPDLGEFAPNVDPSAMQDVPVFAAQPPPEMQMQPGMGIPAEMLDAAAMQAPQPIPVEPDAISGGQVIPIRSVSMAPPEAPPMAFEQDPSGGIAEPLDPYGDLVGQNPLENPNLSQGDTDAAMQSLALRDPAAFEEIAVKQEIARQNMAATEMLAVSERDRVAAEDGVRIQREATAQANARDEQLMRQAEELSQRPIDPDRWWSSRTTGQKIANWISALGGAMSVSGAAYAGHHGMRNQFLDDINKQIDQDIELQKEQITRGIAGVTQQRGIVADIYRRTGDLYQAGEVARQATLQRAQRDILAKQQMYDPRGTQALALGRTAQEIAGRAAAAREAALKAEFDRAKQVLDMQKTAAEIMKLNAEAAKARGYGMGGGGAGGMKAPKPEEIQLTPEQWEAEGVPGVPRTMSMKELRSLQGVQKGAQEIQTSKETASQKTRELEVPGVKNPDGSQFVWRGAPAEVIEVKKKMAATQKLVRLMDEVLRTRTGWSSDTGNSEELQKLKVAWGNATVEAKNSAELGQLTEGDKDIIIGLLGTADPTGRKDPTEGIEAARRQLIENINADLQFKGRYEGRFDIKPPPTAPAATTIDDDGLKAGISTDVRDMNATEFLDQLTRDEKATFPKDADGAKQTAWLEANGWSANGNTLPPMTKKAIDRHSRAPRPTTPDEVKNSKDVQALKQLAKEGYSPRIREYAQAALDNLLALPVTPEHAKFGPSSSSTARDTIAEPPKAKK